MEYDNDILFIEAYFENRLSSDEKEEFEKKKLDDPEFRKKVDDYRLIFESLRESEKETFESRLKEWDKEIDSKTKINKLPPYLKYAAIILLLLVPVGLWQFGVFDNDLSNKEAYLSYYSPYEDVITERGENQSSLFLDGMKAYNSGDFERATEFLASFIEQNPNSDMATVYLGISYLETDNNNEAISLFRKILSDSNGLPKELAQWYLSLAYLKTDQAEEAKSLLRSISSEDHIFSKKATKLLSRLE